MSGFESWPDPGKQIVKGVQTRAEPGVLPNSLNLDGEPTVRLQQKMNVIVVIFTLIIYLVIGLFLFQPGPTQRFLDGKSSATSK